MEEIVDEAPIGLRERKKNENLIRIKKSAGDLFIEQGFDETTIRQIAAGADVSVATIFRYAQDKRDLLFLIFTEPFSKTNDTAFMDIPEGLPLLDKLVIVFRRFFSFFLENEKMIRYVLRESAFYRDTENAEVFQNERTRLLGGIREIIAGAQTGGEIDRAKDNLVMAKIVHSIYGSEARIWLNDQNPEIEHGLFSLRIQLDMAIKGFQ